MPNAEMAVAVMAEADRQLAEQRAQADALATRSGLMIAATTVLAGVLTGVSRDVAGLPPSLLWLLGGGAVAGVIVLCMSRIAAGPSTALLALWGASQLTTTPLLQSKLLAIEANAKALLRTELVFFAQALITVASLIVLANELRGLT